MQEAFERILEQYNRGRFVDAWVAAEAHGPPASWPEVEPRLLGGRLVMNLGAPRLGRLIHLKTHRAHRQHPEAQLYYVWAVMEFRGPVEAWRERKRLGAPDESAGGAAMADYHGQCAHLLGWLRDFDAAEEQLRLAFEATAPHPWRHVEQAAVYELEDRYEECVEAAQMALSMDGCLRSAVVVTAHALQLVGRGDEALDLLRVKASELQSSHVVGQLIGMLINRRLLDEAEEALERYRSLTPIREKEAEDWIGGTLANIAGHRGDYQGVLGHIEQLDQPYYRRVADNLSAFLRDHPDATPRKVEHSVPFVRQHHLTCVPATLSAISGFWNKPAEHLSVSEEICYDGTPAHSERKWAEENGWRAREFRADWKSACQLIDRGVPFTLTVSDVTSGHLQAVIGYDEAEGVLRARDPFIHDTLELNAVDFFDAQQSVGPRGMALVPVEQSGLLDGVQLPEADLYDLYHALHVELDAHNRPGALDLYRKMQEHDAGHRLTLMARRALAAYDANPQEALGAIDQLLELYPDDEALLLARLHSLQELSTRNERVGWLEEVCHRESAGYTLLLEYASELSADDREADRAMWYYRRALRRRPSDPHALHQLAVMTWRQGRWEEAEELYRFAACLADRKEMYVASYFSAARWLGHTDAALRLLRGRCDLLGGRSGYPWMTLFSALDQLDRVDEAFEVLDEALRRLPDDGDLQLFAAARHAQFGNGSRAGEHLSAAKGRVKHTAWLTEAATQARLQGDLVLALERWREVLEYEPLDLTAHRMTAQLLAETSSLAEAVAHLSSFCRRFPHHAGLCHLRYESTAGDPAAQRESALRELLDIDPANAWVHRELALNLYRQCRFDEALSAAREATSMDASTAAGFSIEGYVLERTGHTAKAAACFRQAIEREADAGDAIRGLLTTGGSTVAELKRELDFVESELLKQALFGDGFLAFREMARGILTPAEMLTVLRRAYSERPDMWQSHSALAQHLSEMGHTDEALEVAREATRSFSKLPKVWLDLSRVHRQRLEPEEQVAALERARELNADWIEPVMDLCDVLWRTGRGAESRRLVEACIKRTPLEPGLRGRLAQLLYDGGEVEQALDVLRETVRIFPDYQFGWEMLLRWSAERGKAPAVLDMARERAEACSGESHAWVRLTELQLAAGAPEPALASLDRALEIDPRNRVAHDQKAVALVALRRFEDAAKACSPAVFGDRVPFDLRGRKAWVDGQRGDLTSAIKAMRAVVTENPDYQWAWEQLVEWHAQQEELQEAMEAAERLAWLDPTNAAPLGWLADIKAKLGDKNGARDVYRRAFETQPDYLFAGFEYFGLQLESEALDGAERTLEVLSLHAPPERIAAAQVRLAVARSDSAKASALLQDLYRNRSADQQALIDATWAMHEAGLQPTVERALRQVLDEGSWHDVVPGIWAEVVAQRGHHGSAADFRWLRRFGDRAKPAVNRLLMALGDVAKSPPSDVAFVRARIRWRLGLIRRFFRSWWSTDTQCWAGVGYVLLASKRYRDGRRWLAGWETRPHLEGWMLQNVVVAYMNDFLDKKIRRAAEALRYLGRHRFLCEQADPALRLWCAVNACVDGDVELAGSLLHETPSDVVPENLRSFRHFAEAMVVVLGGPRRRSSDNEPSLEVIAAGDAGTPSDVPALRLYPLAKHKAAKHVRDARMILRTWVDLNWSNLVFLGILLVVLAAIVL